MADLKANCLTNPCSGENALPQSRRNQSRSKKLKYPARTNAPPEKTGSKYLTPALLVVAIIALAVAAYFRFWPDRSGGSNEMVTAASGLQYRDDVIGTGPSPSPGQAVTVHYTGMFTDGTKFESSLDQNQPITFEIGRGKVIKGWDEGLMTMKVGGKRRLVIPPALGYGLAGKPPKIRPNATLVFDVELVGVK
jgi:peptidylprolyl isomerase